MDYEIYQRLCFLWSSGVRENGKYFFIEWQKKCTKKNAPLTEIWKDTMREVLQVSRLTVKQKKEWEELGENLGYLDCEMQLVLLQICQEHFQDFIREEQEKYKKHARLYQTMGVMSGIFLVVIFI